MTISIIICTRNRAESLRSTLRSLGAVAVPPGWAVELLVVDNGSTDSTPRAVREAALANVAVRYAFEAKEGQCRARNTGLAQISGEIILFTDDDVRLPTNWIEGMCRPIESGQADAVAGGVVFPADIASTLSKSPYASIRSWLASTEELDRDSPYRMVGANMAFHRRILKEVPQFDVELGPGALGFADETLFSEQLCAAGYRLIGALDVAIEHHFEVSRLNAERILELARKMGRSSAFMHHHWSHRPFPLLGTKLLYCRSRRFLINLGRTRGESASEEVSSTDIRLERNLAFYREFNVQRQRPRKYPPHREAGGSR